MVDVYLITLGLAVFFGLAATIGLLLLSRTVRFSGIFHVARGIQEKPRWGGAAILFAFAVTPFLASALSDQAAGIFEPKSGDFLLFLGACTVIFAIGFLDDLRMMSAQSRLVVQVGAAIAVYAAGYRLDVIGLPWGPEISLWYFAPVATVLWVVFFTNAINLVDGRDGVAAGVSIMAAITLAAVAANSHHPTVALLLVAAVGGTLGMLLFNLPPATVYVGDSGAYLLGFIIGSLSIRAATGVEDAVFVAIPIMAMGFPILDTVLAIVRRTLHGRHPLIGDQDHIHHRLEVTGFGPRGLMLVIYSVSALFVGAALLLHYVHFFALEMAVLVGTLLVIAAVLTRLGYVLHIWNSDGVVWLRRRLRWVEADDDAGMDGDSRPVLEQDAEA
jgi:UDP-GlcNAc:undecaprenyl-phosphate GlcNAc-1-phosphate transferase